MSTSLSILHLAAKKAHVHEMLGAVIIVAHASEILRVVREIHIWHIGIAALLFALWLIPDRKNPELE